MQDTILPHENWIILSERNEASAFGGAATHILLHYRSRLDELYRGAKKQHKINMMFGQFGINRYFVMKNGDVLAGSQFLTGVLAYLKADNVLVRRDVPGLYKTEEHDAKCNALFRRLDALKAQGADKIKGGEYDAVLRELQMTTKERLGACGLIAPSLGK